MTAEKALQKSWVELPSGRYVSSGRMQYEGKGFRLSHAANMDVSAFNKLAGRYGVRIEETDPPIDRLVNVSVLLSRMGNDNSFMPNNPQYVGMALDVAVAKTKYDRLMQEGKTAEAERFKPLADFYKTLKGGPLDAVAEVLEFHELLSGGKHNGKYKATPHVFNGNGTLEPVDDAITIAPEGWTRALGRRGYPTDTAKDECFIENIEDMALSGKDLQGYWFVGSDPVGEQRIVLRGPVWDGERLLNADVGEGRSFSLGDVGALRLREALPEDYAAKLTKARAELNGLQTGLDTIQAEIGRLAKKK